MATLTGKLVAETYRALLKTIDNDILIASEKQITDGYGGGSGIFLDSQGFIRANKYKVTNGLATQFLKADGSIDGNTYLTGITSSQVIMALGYTPVPQTRLITINNTTYDLSQNRTWTLDSGGGTWGDIVGTLSNQTDLQNALDEKYDNPTGTIEQYIRGDGSIATLPNSASKTRNEVKLGATLSKGTPVYVSSANGTNMIVSASSNTTEATSSKTFGLLETGGVLNDIVECVTFGLIDGLDTSAATAGDPVWLGPNGTLLFGLANKPYAPAHMVYIGVVTRVQSNNGEIFVNVQNGFELDELHNVSARTPSNNEGIFYETSTSLWKNKTIDDALGYTPQRLDKMVSNLLASDTEYPNSNAVIAKLNLKANIENPEFTGSMNITGIESRINFYDQYNTRKFLIGYNTGTLTIYQDTGSAARFYINPAGKTFIPGDLEIGTISKSGGTSSQFFKADGSIDSTSYAPISTLSNYLLITTAASTYQRIDKMVSNLLASDTEYPNSNAVLAKLALKADAENPSFTGYMTIGGAYPKIYLTDSDNNPDYFIGNDDGYLRIYDQTNTVSRFYITSSGSSIFPGDVTVGSIAKSGGTSSQFLKADGSIDSNSYVSSATLANYLLISTATSTYQRLDKMVSNLLASDTEYPNSNAVLAKLALKADAENPVFTGNMTISGIAPKLYFTDTDNNPDYTLFVDSGYFYIYDQTAGATKFQITPSGNAINTGTMTASSFIKAGGTSSQYLMADGSVTTGGGGITGSGTTSYIPKWTSGSALGNSLIYDNGTNVGINTASPASILHVNGGALMTGGWNKTTTLQASFPVLIFNSTATKWAGIGYDHSVGLNFWVNASSDNLSGVGTVALQILNSGAAKFSSTVTTGDILYVGNNGLGGGIWTWNNSDAYIYSPSGKNLWLTANGTNSSGLKIATNGAATFSNSVSALNFLVPSSYEIRLLNSNASNWGTIKGSTDSINGFITLTGGSGNGMIVTNSGYVGLGTTSPLAPMHANGGTTMTGGWVRTAMVSSIFPVFVFNSNSSKYAGLGYDYSGGGQFILWVNATSENVPGSGTQAFNIANSGAAWFSSSITATSFFESSDIRLKKLINGLAQIEGIENLEAKLYEKNGKIELGYFAQDAEKLMPYAVTKNADGFLSLSYREVHTAKIARLEKRVAELEKQLNVA